MSASRSAAAAGASIGSAASSASESQAASAASPDAAAGARSQSANGGAAAGASAVSAAAGRGFAAADPDASRNARENGNDASSSLAPELGAGARPLQSALKQAGDPAFFSDGVFDGAKKREGRVAGFLRRAAAAVVVGAALLGAQAPARAQDGALRPAAVVVDAPVKIEAAAAREAYSVADAIKLNLRFKNESNQPVVVALEPVHDQIREGLAPSFEVLEFRDGELFIPAGASITMEIELGVSGLPEDLKPGGEWKVSSRPFTFDSNGRRFSVPSFDVTLRSDLTEDWKDQGLKSAQPWRTDFRLDPYLLALYILGGGGLFALLHVWSKRRALAEKVRDALDVPPHFSPKGFSWYQDELDRLGRELDRGIEPLEYHRRLAVLLNNFFIFFLHLQELSPEDYERAGRTLRRMTLTLQMQNLLSTEQIATLSRIAVKSERGLYGEKPYTKEQLKEQLNEARELVGKLVVQRRGQVGGFAALPLFAFAVGGVQFASPWFLLLLAPVAVWIVWHLFKKKTPSFTAPSGDWLPGKKSLRQRFMWLPGLLLTGALVFGIGSAADPIWGYKTKDRVVTSLDNVVVIDRSGSMESALQGGHWSVSKLEAAKQAAYQFTQRQHGTTNRVGLILFTDEARLVMNLSLDYDAIESVFTQTQADGGTAIGAGLDAALAHFIEVNIVDLDPKGWPGAKRVRELLKTEGLASALEEAGKNPALLEALLAPDRHKAVILMSDGMTFDEGRAREAVKRAKAMGIRIYAIGVPDADQRLMQEMADGTGGQFIWVEDNAGIQNAFLEIDRLQKAWVKAHGMPQPIHHDKEFAQIAWALAIASLMLWATALRPAMPPVERRKNLLSLMVLAPFMFPAGAPDAARMTAAFNVPLAQASAPDVGLRNPVGGFSPWDLSPYRETPQIRRGRELYEQGDYAEALKEFSAAAAADPSAPDARLFAGITQSRLGQKAEAEASFTEAARLARSANRPDVQAASYIEQGNLAASGGDAKAAMRSYREALRVRPTAARGDGNANLEGLQRSARWNYEAALRGLPPPNGGQGQSGEGQGQQGQGQSGQGQGQNQQGEGQNQQGQGQNQQGQGQNQQGQGQNQQGQGQNQQGQGQNQQGQGQNQQGQGQPQNGQGQPETTQGQNPQGQDGQQPAPAAESAGQNAVRQIGEQDKKNPAGGSGRRGVRGQAWGFAAALFGAAPLMETFFLADPIFLWLTLVAAPVLAVLSIFIARKRHKAARRLAGEAVPKKLLSWPSGRRFLLRAALLLMGLIALGFAAAGPSKGTKDESFSFGGKDVVVLQDVSWSVMFSEDGRYGTTTDGLERFARWLTNGSSADRSTIVPFAATAGESVLSNDHRNLIFQTYHLRQDAFYLEEGTDYLAAVQRAVQVFESATNLGDRDRVAIVISDGDGKNAAAAAELARQKKITLHVLGIGSLEGARMPIPKRDREAFGGKEFIGDGAVSKLEEAPLQEMASGTGGEYRRGESGQSIEFLLAELAQRESGKQKGSMEVAETLSKLAVWPALLLFLAAALLGERKRKEEGGAPSPEEAAKRSARNRFASGHLRYDRILHGRFRSPFAVNDGENIYDSVQHTDQPWKNIDHKLSARTGNLHAKRFEVEPEVPVYLLVDVSASSAFSSGATSKREVLEDVAEAMALAAVRERRPVGMILFSDGVEKTIPARRGTTHAEGLLKTLRDFKPAGKATNLAEPLRRAAKIMKKRGVMVVLSDFDAEGYENALTAAAARHVVVPVVVEDSLEAKPMENVEVLDVVDAETGRTARLDTTSARVRGAVAEKVQARRERTRRALDGDKTPPLYLSNDGAHLRRLVQYFENGGRLK